LLRNARNDWLYKALFKKGWFWVSHPVHPVSWFSVFSAIFASLR
jgi:hypothetical protein